MAKKIITLIERNSVQELKDYFADMSAETPLDSHEEMVLLEHFLPEAVKSYINRFRLSEKAEVAFIEKAPIDLRKTYINYYGLRWNTQKHIIDTNLCEVADDFMQLRRFDDDAYLLEHASVNILRSYVSLYVLEGDKLVISLLNHENPSLIKGYISKGRFISEAVQKEIIDQKNDEAFSALMYRFYNKFKRLSRKTTDCKALMKQLADVALSEELQLRVVRVFDRMMLEILLKTTPLAPSVQELLFLYNVDAHWLKLHVTSLYGRGGYRFEAENEKKLFKVLINKDLDECLTTFRHCDDVTFVKLASEKAVEKYLQDYWLTDDGQVALMQRHNTKLAKTLISRYSPEHGLCWQAEVELAKDYGSDVLKEYISFHSMCREALEILEKRKPEMFSFYFTKHQY